MVSVLDKIGKLVRDVVYEAFMDLTLTTELDELKKKGFVVREFHLDPSGMDKLYVLSKDEVIQMSGTITTDRETMEPEVHLHNGTQTMKILKLIRSKPVTGGSPVTDNPTN